MEWQAFLGIIAIIGIVVVVGGIIAFLGHVVIGAFDNEDRSTKQPKQEVMDYTQYKQQNLLAEQNKQQDYDFESINEAKAKKEEELVQDNKEDDLFKLIDENDSNLDEIENRLKKQNEESDEVERPATDVKTLEDAPMAVEEEKADEADSDDDIDIQNLIDEINNEVVDEEKEKADEQAEDVNPVLAEYDINKIMSEAEQNTDDNAAEESIEESEEAVAETEPEIEEETAEQVEETNVGEETEAAEQAAETEETTDAETEQTEEVVETPVEEQVEEEKVETVEESNKELEDANKRIAELTSKIDELNKQLSAQSVATTEVVTIDMTEDECLNRIAVLEERLKNAKKDYKTNMKEYRPLKKVMNDLDRYQTKLRRKETVFAKKNVALYGVNNYVDLDKEKQEELEQELELLNGLRASVTHCEEVIEANKDRFPILERTNKILEEQIAQLESDLELANATLQKIRERDGKGEGENNQ